MRLSKYKPPYAFSTHIGTACNVKFRTFQDLPDKLRIPVKDLIRQCNGKVPSSKALVKGLAKELDINESYLGDAYRRNNPHLRYCFCSLGLFRLSDIVPYLLPKQCIVASRWRL
jgi:hypothetical protein